MPTTTPSTTPSTNRRLKVLIDDPQVWANVLECLNAGGGGGSLQDAYDDGGGGLDLSFVGGPLVITNGADNAQSALLVTQEAPDELALGVTGDVEVLGSFESSGAVQTLDATDGNALIRARAGIVQLDSPTTEVTGNLVVRGTVTHRDEVTVLVADAFLVLNAGYGVPVAKTGGAVVVYNPTATSDAVADGGFVAGVPGVSNPTVATTGSATFSVGQIIQVSGANNPDNDGLYEVLSHLAEVLTIRGVGLTGTLEAWTQNQVTSDPDAGGTITWVNVAVNQTSATGDPQTGKGNTTPLTYVDLVELGGQLGGSGASPDVRGLRETEGPTLLTYGAIPDGTFLKRDGTGVVGVALATLLGAGAYNIDPDEVIPGSYPTVDDGIIAWVAAYPGTRPILQIRDFVTVAWDGTLHGAVGGISIFAPTEAFIDLSGFTSDAATPDFEIDLLNLVLGSTAPIELDSGWFLYLQNCGAFQSNAFAFALGADGGFVLAENCTFDEDIGTFSFVQSVLGGGGDAEFVDCTFALFCGTLFELDETSSASVTGGQLRWFNAGAPTYRFCTDGSLDLENLYFDARGGPQLFDTATVNFIGVRTGGGFTFGTDWAPQGGDIEFTSPGAGLPAYPDLVPEGAMANWPTSAQDQDLDFTSGRAMGPRLWWNANSLQWEGANGAVAMVADTSDADPTVANAVPVLDQTTDLYRMDPTGSAKYKVGVSVIVGQSTLGVAAEYTLKKTVELTVGVPTVLGGSTYTEYENPLGAFEVTLVASPGGVQVSCDQKDTTGVTRFAVLVTAQGVTSL